jgi:SAM-dependent methyltransferase
MALYERDLARVQADGFGAFAAAAAPALVARLRAARAPVRRVLDVGCGAGITTRALVDAGFDVIAIEPSDALLAIARTTVPEATFLHASAYDAAFPPCDAILAVGEPLSYHAPDVDADARVQRFFASAAAALPALGLLVFDLLVAEGPSLDARGFRSEADWAILWETREDRAAGRLTRTIETFVREGDTYRRAHEVHRVKLFAEGELRAWLDRAGFDVDVSAAYGDHPLAPRRLAFFATRRNRAST